ncbi:hypothetical protein ABPG73_022953 [Tetrahymena malaccensis]
MKYSQINNFFGLSEFLLAMQMLVDAIRIIIIDNRNDSQIYKQNSPEKEDNMCQNNNRKQNRDINYRQSSNNQVEKTSLMQQCQDIFQYIQQLYDECEFEICLEAINKVLSDFSSSSGNKIDREIHSISYGTFSTATPFSFSLKQRNVSLPIQIEDIIVKKGYCLFRLKQFACLENKILTRYHYLPRIQRLQLQYLFETKNFYKVLEILQRNTSNNIENQKMRVYSLFELNRYQECLEALRPLEMHMKRCNKLSYIQSICLKNTGQNKEYIILATKLIEEEKLNSNFIRKLLKGVLNFYLQESSSINIADMHNYCAIFSRNYQKYLQNPKKFEKFHQMYNTFIQKLKENNKSNENNFQGFCQQNVNVEKPKKCYICLGEFPLAFSICKNFCEFICISCVQSVSIQCIKCMICKTPYY